MSWRDRWQPGSFRGVPFVVLPTDSTGGRRQVEHLYPYRDGVHPEDQGREAKTFLLRVACIGEDHDLEANRLEAAFDREGADVLAYQSRRVRVVVRRYRRSVPEGTQRITYFDCEFVEVGLSRVPTSLPDPEQKAEAAKRAIFPAQRSALEGGLKTQGWSESVVEAARSALRKASGVYDAVNWTLAREREVNRVLLEASRIARDASILVQTPANLASRVMTNADAVLDAWGTGYRSAVSAYTHMLKLRPDFSGRSGLNAEQSDRNARLVMNTQRLAGAYGAVLASIRAARLGQYDSLQDAYAERAVIESELDALAGDVSDDLYLQLLSLRAQIVDGVPPRGEQRLPNVGHYTPAEDMPSLLVAYAIDGTADAADQIAARNLARHPGFLPGGVPLEVLIASG